MGDPLPYQLQDARAMEEYAKWKRMELTSPLSQAHAHEHHSSSGEEFNPRPQFSVPDQNGAQLQHLQPPTPHHHGYTDSPTHTQAQMPPKSAAQMVSSKIVCCTIIHRLIVVVRIYYHSILYWLCTCCYGNLLICDFPNCSEEQQDIYVCGLHRSC